MPAILLRGLGLGFLFLSITLIAFSRLAPANLAFGIGIFNIGRQLGGLIGVAGLQTVIDHQVVANQAVLGAALSVRDLPPWPSGWHRRPSLLVARGIEAGAAARAATSMLGRAVAGQATVIAFDTAFNIVALLFVVAAPILIAVKIAARPRREAPQLQDRRAGSIMTSNRPAQERPYRNPVARHCPGRLYGRPRLPASRPRRSARPGSTPVSTAEVDAAWWTKVRRSPADRAGDVRHRRQQGPRRKRARGCERPGPIAMPSAAGRLRKSAHRRPPRRIG